MSYNVVTNYRVISEIKKCRYFRVNLGMAVTMEKNGDRLLNDKDNFAHFYNIQYKTSIYGQGNIGNIKFYVDHYIKDDVLAFYYKTEEFIFNLEKEIINEKGIEFFLGHCIKRLETEHEDRIKMAEEKKLEPKKKANPDNIINNPGNVNYDDVMEYIKRKNQNRFNG
jgi:hypothetical protein